MIYGFYFRFLKITHNRQLSIFLSRLAYFVYEMIFTVKKVTSKNKYSIMSNEEANEIISQIRNNGTEQPEYINPPRDNSVQLSIVVPVYNYKELIESNIDSIVNQRTKYSYEVIIVDDGSTDGSGEILKKYADLPNVRVIYQKNKGIAGARNTGINNAVGKYLMFVDCDDLLHNNIVEVLLERAIREDLDMAMCAHNLVKESNGEIISVIPNVYPQANLLNYKNNDEIMNYAGLPWAKVYKRELWNDVRFFPGYWYEDNIIQILIFPKVKKFAYVPKPMYEYRWYEKNFSHVQGNRANTKATDVLFLLERILEQYEKNGLPKDEMFYDVLLKHLSMYYYCPISQLDDDIIEAMFIKASELLGKYKMPNVRQPYVLKNSEKALQTKNITLWKLSSRYQ